MARFLPSITHSHYILYYIRQGFKARLEFPISNNNGQTTSYNKIRFQWETKNKTTNCRLSVKLISITDHVVILRRHAASINFETSKHAIWV